MAIDSISGAANLPVTLPQTVSQRETGQNPPGAAQAANQAAKTTDPPRPTQDAQKQDNQDPSKQDQRSLKEQLEEATKKANDSMQFLRSNLQFSVDKDTGMQVVKVINSQTNEVIRQIPSDEMLQIAKRLDELKGLLIHEKA